MSSLKLLSLALAVLAVVSVTVGTTGFASVDAQRDVDVAVVDDDESYVGVAVCPVPAGASGSGTPNEASENAPSGAGNAPSGAGNAPADAGGDSVGDEPERPTADGAAPDGSAVNVRVTNQYTAEFDVSIRSSDAPRDGDPDRDGSVSVGDSRVFHVAFAAPVESVTVEVVAAGFEATVTRDVVSSTGCSLGVESG